ncbi:MAG: response regulator [Ignavibacteriales bacterium]|nr:response regulator [Ignavibacteriales bacterium]
MKDRYSILIVDDDKTLRVRLRVMLTKEGFDTAATGNGISALIMLNKHRYDLLLLDNSLPRINGLAILKMIRQKKLIEKVIMLSKANDLKTVQKILSTGANDVITKPLDAKSLLACINRELGIHLPMTSNGEGVIPFKKIIVGE